MLQSAKQAIKSTYDKAMRLARDGHISDAASLLDGLALQAPSLPEVHFQRARLATLLGEADKRQIAIDTALKLRPQEPAIVAEAIEAHTVLGNHDTVLELHDQQIARDPKAVKPQADKALYLQQAGQFEASEKLFRKLLKKNPNDAELYRMFAATHRFKPNDPLIGAMRRLAKHPKLSPKGVMQINYALAKAMEDTRQTDKVFPHLRKANNSQAALWPEDVNERKEEWQAVVAAQDGLAPIETKEATSPNLIFVTGLPRSGTTLAEQIIGSHSQVQAGGEIATALRTAYTAFGSGTDMQKLGVLPQDQLRDFAKKLEMQNKRYANAAKPCLTDKSIMAFLIYGLLHAALPNARFVVVHRDPRDIAVSIYKNYFTGGTHRYANDLISIADTIKSFRAIIAQWRQTLPDRFTEVRYEDLVAEPISGSKALIAAAGLPWEDQCLRFHENTGTVKTLSLHQVRQPVYQSSAAAWRRYETDLQPFFDAWGDTPWD